MSHRSKGLGHFSKNTFLHAFILIQISPDLKDELDCWDNHDKTMKALTTQTPQGKTNNMSHQPDTQTKIKQSLNS